MKPFDFLAGIEVLKFREETGQCWIETGNGGI